MTMSLSGAKSIDAAGRQFAGSDFDREPHWRAVAQSAALCIDDADDYLHIVRAVGARDRRRAGGDAKRRGRSGLTGHFGGGTCA